MRNTIFEVTGLLKMFKPSSSIVEFFWKATLFLCRREVCPCGECWQPGGGDSPNIHSSSAVENKDSPNIHSNSAVEN